MNERRNWLLGGAVVAVLAMAGGVAWRRRQDAGADDPAGTPPPLGDARELLPPAIDLRGGGQMTAAQWHGRPLVLNFWASWCGPCVKEMPELDRFARAQAARGASGAQVIGLAVDDAPAVDEFLGSHPVSFPISVLGFAGLAWVRKLSNDPSPALPFSAVFDAQGRLSHRKFGATDFDELTRWTTAGGV